MKIKRLPAGALTVSAIEPAKRCEAFALSLAELATVLKHHRGHMKRQNLELDRMARIAVKIGFEPGPKFIAKAWLLKEQVDAHQKRANQLVAFIQRQINLEALKEAEARLKVEKAAEVKP